MMIVTYALAFVFCYVCGSIPFGLLLTRLAGGPDVRSVGSGNIGATNVLRTGRKGLAAATLVGDMLKGTFAVLAVIHFCGREVALLAAPGAFLGHLFPVWLGFKGGKGVATYIGLLLALAPVVAIIFGAVWLAVAALSRHSSAAALMASAATPVALLLFRQLPEAGVFAALTALLWIMHRANIARLLNRSEARIGEKPR
jgi:glycerol-3-phosphate acyltransferase PlsY